MGLESLSWYRSSRFRPRRSTSIRSPLERESERGIVADKRRESGRESVVTNVIRKVRSIRENEENVSICLTPGTAVGQ